MKKVMMAVAVAVLMSSSAQAAVVVYTSEAAFNVALAGNTLETFSDATLEPGLSFSSTVGSVGGGVFNDRTVLGGATTTFSFAGGSNGFGATFDQTPGGFGQGLAFYINGTTFVSQLDGAAPGTFFGFISDTAFTSVLITSGTSPGSAETYNLDNLRFGLAGTVPEPATWAMMILGMGATGGAMRYRRRSTKVAFAA